MYGSGRANRIQTRIGLLCAFAAAVVGFVMAPDTKWLGALIGAVTGMIVGVLLVGAAMALLGTKVEEEVTLRQLSWQQYQSRCRWLRVTFGMYLLSSGLAVMFASGGVGGLNAIAMYMLGHSNVIFARTRLFDIACPHCRADFGDHPPFNLEQHRCESCGMTFQLDRLNRKV